MGVRMKTGLLRLLRLVFRLGPRAGFAWFRLEAEIRRESSERILLLL